MTGAVLVVELGLGDRVVDVDGRELQGSVFHHFIQPVHACCGFLADTSDTGGHASEQGVVFGLEFPQKFEHNAPFFGVVIGSFRDRSGRLKFGPLVDKHGGVATIVQDQVGAVVSWPAERLLGAPPVLLERLALPCVAGDPGGMVGGALRADDNRCRGFILGGEDVAADPANLSS